ncbi:MAG: hypothetical protein RLZZ08_509 [Pseudomonadota bacterium]|jgi:cytochrome c556
MKFAGYALVSTLALLGACSGGKQPDATAPAPTFHEIMKEKVDKNADALWDLTNTAISDDAGLDAGKLTDAQWTEMATRAEAVQQAALEIAAMPDPIVVAKPGVKIADEGIQGGHTAAMVQKEVDRNPQGLRDMSSTMAAHMGDMAKALRAHDAAKAGPLIDQLDGVCESCHLEYWYPTQKALIEKYGIKTK